jgi:hypothetical protein
VSGTAVHLKRLAPEHVNAVVTRLRARQRHHHDEAQQVVSVAAAQRQRRAVDVQRQQAVLELVHPGVNEPLGRHNVEAAPALALEVLAEHDGRLPRVQQRRHADAAAQEGDESVGV